ncbi:MAG: hypothetical protein JWM32_1463 [Verrucomicrobia bacterium]|nr:hypothetical protein [Verrucomicrobiota bacterium]
MKTLITSLVILCAAGFTGCSTFNSRAQAKSAAFNALPAQTQQRLEKGKVTVGDSQDMVFIALDKPDATRNITTANGPETVWIYKSYWQNYAGTGWVGWHRYYEPQFGGAYAFYHQQVPLALSTTRSADVIRVTFKNGKVVAVNQAAT